jgi:hypothetical protein
MNMQGYFEMDEMLYSIYEHFMEKNTKEVKGLLFITFL